MTTAPTPRSAHPGRTVIGMPQARGVLDDLLRIPRPAGYTDEIAHRTGDELWHLDVPFGLTRPGTIRADLEQWLYGKRMRALMWSGRTGGNVGGIRHGTAHPSRASLCMEDLTDAER